MILFLHSKIATARTGAKKLMFKRVLSVHSIYEWALKAWCGHKATSLFINAFSPRGLYGGCLAREW